MANAENIVNVTSVKHYTDRLFSFRTTRPKSLRFEPGQFIMLGLQVEGKPLMRAYSMASPNWDDELEFFSIKVPNGPLTSKLQHIKINDEILLSDKAVGNLTLKSLKAGKRLFMLSTGTGIAPFSSIVRNHETYERFESVYLTHTCRLVSELKYGHDVLEKVKKDPLCAEFSSKLKLYSTTTREAYENEGRITDLIVSGKFFSDMSIEPFDPKVDRVMLCGSIEFNNDMKAILENYGFSEGSIREPGEYVLEKAFVG